MEGLKDGMASNRIDALLLPIAWRPAVALTTLDQRRASGAWLEESDI